MFQNKYILERQIYILKTEILIKAHISTSISLNLNAMKTFIFSKSLKLKYIIFSIVLSLGVKPCFLE